MLGAKVVGYALELPSTPALLDVARVADGMVSLHGDIRELGSMQNAMQTHRPDIVIHMAAQSMVRYSYQEQARK